MCRLCRTGMDLRRRPTIGISKIGAIEVHELKAVGVDRNGFVARINLYGNLIRRTGADGPETRNSRTCSGSSRDTPVGGPDSERFWSTPKTCGRFRRILTLRFIREIWRSRVRSVAVPATPVPYARASLVFPAMGAAHVHPIVRFSPSFLRSRYG